MVLELQNTTVTGGDSEPKESLPDEHGQPFALCRTPPGLQTPTGHRHHHSSILQHSLPASLVLGGHLREIFSLAERLSPSKLFLSQCMPGFSQRSSLTLDRALCFQQECFHLFPSSTCRQWHSSASLGRDPPPGRLAHLHFKITSDMHFDTTVPPLSFPHYLALFRAWFFLPLPKHNDCYN